LASQPLGVDHTTALLTGLGLCLAAGLNAYIPLITVVMLIRFGGLDVASP